MPEIDEAQSVSDLLYEGEEQVDSLRVGDAQVVLTSHRLLVVREGGAPRLRAVDRPNLGAVRTRTLTDRGHLLSAAGWTVLGALLLAVWRVVPFDVFTRPVTLPPELGMGDLVAAVNTLISLLELLDEAFLAAGALALGWAAVRIGRYLHGRERVLEVTVHGEDPVRLTVPGNGEGVDRLRTLVQSAKARAND